MPRLNTPPHRPPYAVGEICRVCGQNAYHKVGEESSALLHNFTAYLCCFCFGLVMGPVAMNSCERAAKREGREFR